MDACRLGSKNGNALGLERAESRRALDSLEQVCTLYAYSNDWRVSSSIVVAQFAEMIDQE